MSLGGTASIDRVALKIQGQQFVQFAVNQMDI